MTTLKELVEQIETYNEEARAITKAAIANMKLRGRILAGAEELGMIQRAVLKDMAKVQVRVRLPSLMVVSAEEGEDVPTVAEGELDEQPNLLEQ